MGWVQVSSFWFSFIFFLSFSQSYHNRTHLGLTKTLSRISNNLSHDQTHTGEKPRQCKHCDKTLCKKVTLRNHFVKRLNNFFHEQCHTGEKPRSCKHCDKTLCKIATLRNHFVKRFKHFFHEQNHTGEKPHSCKHCDKTLCQRATLRNHFVKRFKHSFHEQNHTGEKQHQGISWEKIQNTSNKATLKNSNN